jgi:hypothetical protein
MRSHAHRPSNSSTLRPRCKFVENRQIGAVIDRGSRPMLPPQPRSSLIYFDHFSLNHDDARKIRGLNRMLRLSSSQPIPVTSAFGRRAGRGNRVLGRRAEQRLHGDGRLAHKSTLTIAHESPLRPRNRPSSACRGMSRHVAAVHKTSTRRSSASKAGDRQPKPSSSISIASAANAHPQLDRYRPAATRRTT